MNISASPNSEEFTASAVTLSANGSKDSDSEPNPASHQPKRSAMGASHNDPARNLGHSSTSGSEQERHYCSMPCSTQGPFLIRSNRSIGQVILDADGRTVAWTTDLFVTQVICGLMNEHANNQEQRP